MIYLGLDCTTRPLDSRSNSSGDIRTMYSPVDVSFSMTFIGVLLTDSTDPPLLLRDRLQYIFRKILQISL